jgi:hypothetical protein
MFLRSVKVIDSKKILKIPKRLSEVKICRTNKSLEIQTMLDKGLHRKRKIKDTNTSKNQG